MANITLNLNSAASAMIGDEAKVRVRIKDGVLQIRPTNRVLGRNLPDGEILCALRLKKQAVRGTFRFTIANYRSIMGGVDIGDQFKAIPSKHGWISLHCRGPLFDGALAKDPETGRFEAGATVSDR